MSIDKIIITAIFFMFDIDRKTASRLLKISLRTVDRYIEAQKLSHERREGRVWLDKKEITQLKAQRRVDIVRSRMSIDKSDLVPVDMSIDSDGNTVHSVYSDYSSDGSDSSSKNSSRRARTPNSHSRENDENINAELELLKKLYAQLQEELKAKEQRLEVSNYRLGQLEARIKESIPLLEYKRGIASEQAEKTRLRKDLDARLMELDMEKNNFREEKFNKTVYLILLFILLLLQPLWFLIPPR